jgi:hypothetical protein
MAVGSEIAPTESNASNASENDEEEAVSPFTTDKYILPEEWSNPLAKAWIRMVAIPVRKVTESELFNNTILVAIIIAGVLVGIQTCVYRASLLFYTFPPLTPPPPPTSQPQTTAWRRTTS